MSTIDLVQRTNRRLAGRAVPAVLAQRFDADIAGDLRAVYELRVVGPGGVVEDRFALQIDHGTLTVERRAAPEAVAWVAMSLRDMLAVVEGNVSPWKLMAAKRLDIGGEPFMALRFPPLFGLV